MSQPLKLKQKVNPKELQTALENLLSQHFGRRCRIVELETRPYAYSSSFALEEIDIRLEDGTRLEILFKDLGRHALLEGARQAKPVFLYNPLREIDTYRLVLAAYPMGTATCYGAVVDPHAGRYWLFLEKVTGPELYQVGEIRLWQEAARWLANLHHRFLGTKELDELATIGRWLIYDDRYYRQWLERAAAYAGNDETRKEMDRLASVYEAVIERLASLPATFIHGEFYASNILVPATGSKVRVCPVDWEMAALGPGLLDLAALTVGKWQDQERDDIALAYYQALTANKNRPEHDEFLADLDFCRLHLSLQWLGWSPGWQPPPEHAQNWLREALSLAQKLGI
jgi:hypothetical protein